RFWVTWTGSSALPAADGYSLSYVTLTLILSLDPSTGVSESLTYRDSRRELSLSPLLFFQLSSCRITRIQLDGLTRKRKPLRRGGCSRMSTRPMDTLTSRSGAA